MDKANAQLTGKRMKLFIGWAILCILLVFFREQWLLLVALFLLARISYSPLLFFTPLLGRTTVLSAVGTNQINRTTGSISGKDRDDLCSRPHVRICLLSHDFSIIANSLDSRIRGFDLGVTLPWILIRKVFNFNETPTFKPKA
jgi:hypothetical protein